MKIITDFRNNSLNYLKDLLIVNHTIISIIIIISIITIYKFEEKKTVE